MRGTGERLFISIIRNVIQTECQWARGVFLRTVLEAEHQADICRCLRNLFQTEWQSGGGGSGGIPLKVEREIDRFG